jgi:hypothetical protein
MIAPVSFPTGAIDRTPRQLVTIGDDRVDPLTITAQHGLKQPIGTATITLRMPETPIENLRERWLNQTIEASTGYDEDGGVQRVFYGRVTKLNRAFDRNGFRLDVSASGWAALLDWESEKDIVFPGGTLLYEICRSLCEMRGLPIYGGQNIVYPNSDTDVALGGVEYVDDGTIVIPKRSSPLQWMVTTLGIFGYYACDRPDGLFRWGRVMGQPPYLPNATFQQGRNVFAMSRDDDLTQMVTWWDVDGASYTDGDGVPVEIRSFPDTVPYSPLLDPPGFVHRDFSNAVLVTSPLADAARNVAEINMAAPYEAETWTYAGAPGISPGDVAQLDSPLLELDEAKRWVMSTDHSSSSRGLRTTWTGWQGAGEALDPGDDSVEISVFTDPRHVGDETLSHYAHPSPQGKTISFDITVPDTYTAIVLSGWAHGVNSFLVEGKSSEETVSKIEVWQGETDKPVATATLPSMPENLNKHYPYDAVSPTVWQKYWTKFRIPVPGRLVAGPAKVKLISGKSSKYEWDDYEVRLLVLTLTGVGQPTYPGSS